MGHSHMRGCGSSQVGNNYRLSQLDEYMQLLKCTTKCVLDGERFDKNVDFQ